MHFIKTTFIRAAALFVLFTLLCGVVYPGVVTAAAQVLFPRQAAGSLFEAGGRVYGSTLLAQPFTQEKYFWGRTMEVDVTTFKDTAGNPILYAWPSNLSPASPEFARRVAQRVAQLQKAHPQQAGVPIPADLVTGSASGLDPHISPAAAEYQVARVAAANGMSEEQVRGIVAQCTQRRFLGIFGEETVHVLQANLMLDGLL